MMELTLLRTENTEDGVFGLLTVGHAQLATCEDDWKNNQPSESCIPAGRYKLVRTMYHHGGYECFWITDVPGRSRILIHRGNTEEDTKGCVLVGLRQGKLWVHDEDNPAHPRVEKRAVVSSREAFAMFMKEMQHHDEAWLTILWKDGLP
jgi:hypothetical protein